MCEGTYQFPSGILIVCQNKDCQGRHYAKWEGPQTGEKYETWWKDGD